MSSAVNYETKDRIARITLDDGKVNAMSLGFFEALGAALDRAERELPGAVVIAGRPGIFSAGLDLKLLPPLGAADLRTTLHSFARTMLRVFLFPIPTVAAVSGHAIAGGALLMFACDLRVVADGPARLQLNETAIGLALPSWAILIARSAIPSRWRTEAMLHARPYSPAEANTPRFVATPVPRSPRRPRLAAPRGGGGGGRPARCPRPDGLCRLEEPPPGHGCEVGLRAARVGDGRTSSGGEALGDQTASHSRYVTPGSGSGA